MKKIGDIRILAKKKNYFLRLIKKILFFSKKHTTKKFSEMKWL